MMRERIHASEGIGTRLFNPAILREKKSSGRIRAIERGVAEGRQALAASRQYGELPDSGSPGFADKHLHGARRAACRKTFRCGAPFRAAQTVPKAAPSLVIRRTT
ncbi:hypothetical protein MASR2M32_07770 [Sphaerotilus sulfidivorans]